MADQALDRQLRADLGAPDLRYLVVVSGVDQESVLRAAELVGVQLEKLVDAGHPWRVRYPGSLTSEPRKPVGSTAGPAAPDELAARLQAATRDLPLRPSVSRPLSPTWRPPSNARPLDRADLDGSSFAVALDALLVQREGRWSALAAAQGGAGRGRSRDRPAVDSRGAGRGGQKNVSLLVDLKSETDRFYAGYLAEAIHLSLAGVVVMLALLLACTSFAVRVLRVVAPLVAAVMVVVAVHALAAHA